MKNKHVTGPKHYCQLNQVSSCQRILLTEMSCYVNSVCLMFWPRPHTFWPWPHPSLASLTSLAWTVFPCIQRSRKKYEFYSTWVGWCVFACDFSRSRKKLEFETLYMNSLWYETVEAILFSVFLKVVSYISDTGILHCCGCQQIVGSYMYNNNVILLGLLTIKDFFDD